MAKKKSKTQKNKKNTKKKTQSISTPKATAKETEKKKRPTTTQNKSSKKIVDKDKVKYNVVLTKKQPEQLDNSNTIIKNDYKKVIIKIFNTINRINHHIHSYAHD